jgi:S-sulfo-L-cysteine synthase (O-acetyl-L-serine-dependent)
MSLQKAWADEMTAHAASDISSIDDTDSTVSAVSVGNTPLVRLQRIPVGITGAAIYGKCEWLNPAGSVKDRPAFWMIRDAERKGLLDGRRGLLDSTSGNTGIALAQLGASRGHRVTLCMPANANAARQRLLRLLGATLILTDPLEGDDGARAVAKQMMAAHPDEYVYLDQYSNPMNWQAHYHSTAPEIWRQTGGRVTHFVACMGTSGTFTGTSRRLTELNPAIQRIAVQPDAAYHGIEGTKHYATSDVPPIFDQTLVDRQVEVSTEEAQQMARRLAREEGLPTGTSGGAAVAAALKVAQGLTTGVVVAILPDNVMKALGDPQWEEQRS